MIATGTRAKVEQTLYEAKDTTHVCVVDRDGNAVSMTHSLGMPSGVITDGLGFMYNGCMAVFESDRKYGFIGLPGKSRFDSLCPTMAFEGNQPEIRRRRAWGYTNSYGRHPGAVK